MRIRAVVTAGMFWTGALGAQDSTRAPARAPRDTLHRDPVSAAVLGTIIPGAGHIYAGEYLRGIGTYEGTVALLGSGTLIYMIDGCTFAFGGSCKAGPQWEHRAAGIALVGAGLALWVASAMDAPRAARRQNEIYKRKHPRVSPVIRPAAGQEHGANLGVAVAW